MRRVVLISCSKRKGDKPAKARHLYQSDLFQKSLRYAESLAPSDIYILSAEHGLLAPETVIAPYDTTLKAMKASDAKAWAQRVLGQLRAVANLGEDRFILLAGERYRRYLLPHLAHYDVPMKGRGIGKQLQFLKERAL